MKTVLIILAVFTMPAFADEDGPENYCHDEEVASAWEKMLSESPEDPIIIKLYGLRVGMCGMIDQGKLSLEQGILIWEQERTRGVIQRAKEEAEKKKEFTL